MRGEDDLETWCGEGLPLQYGGPIALSPLGARCRRPRLHPHQVGVAWPITRGRGIPTVAIAFGHRVLNRMRNAAGLFGGGGKVCVEMCVMLASFYKLYQFQWVM